MYHSSNQMDLDKELRGLSGSRRYGVLEEIKALVEKGANPNRIFNDELATAVFSAARFGSLEGLRYLCEKGGDIHVRVHRGITVLISAVEGKELDKVRFLVEKGANINATDCIGQSPLVIAATNVCLGGGGQNRGIMEYLLENGATFNDSDRAIFLYNTTHYKSQAHEVLNFITGYQASLEQKTNQSSLHLIAQQEAERQRQLQIAQQQEREAQRQKALQEAQQEAVRQARLRQEAVRQARLRQEAERQSLELTEKTILTQGLQQQLQSGQYFLQSSSETTLSLGYHSDTISSAKAFFTLKKVLRSLSVADCLEDIRKENGSYVLETKNPANKARLEKFLDQIMLQQPIAQPSFSNP